MSGEQPAGELTSDMIAGSLGELWSAQRGPLEPGAFRGLRDVLEGLPPDPFPRPCGTECDC